MKKLYLLLYTLLISTLSFGQDLIITGVIDGPFTGGKPKAIELYVVNNIADLSIYGLESTNNGPASGAEFNFPADSKVAGEFIYVATEQPLFNQYFGIDPTYTSSVANINGDDAIILYLNGSSNDVFGNPEVDGTGTPWEYMDGWAYRNTGVGPNANFTISEWNFSGINALDGCALEGDTGNNAQCSSIFPIGSYSMATASVNRNDIPNFSIYPNPVTSGRLIIKSNVNINKYIEIYDILGKKQMSILMTGREINISKLNPGIYILKARIDGKTATRKLVIK